jgi:hypothetical protein
VVRHLFLELDRIEADMAKAWTNIAIVEADVTKIAACELSKKSTN